MGMKWTSNTGGDGKYISRRVEETQKEATEAYWKWRRQFTQGGPQATETYSVEELEQQGMVGLYRPAG